MKTLLNPKWILVVNTLPVVILLFLLAGQYEIIHTLLREDELTYWKEVSTVLVLFATCNLAYAIFGWIKRKQIHIVYAFVVLAVSVLFFVLSISTSEQLIPWRIPRWMVLGDMFLYVLTFLMPTVAYSLFIIVVKLTPDNGKQSVWKNLLISIAIPVSWYLFLEVLIPLLHFTSVPFGRLIFPILLVVLSVVFVFFLARTIYLLAIRRATLWKQYQLVGKVLIAIIFPLLGLAINSGELNLFNSLGNTEKGIFGDFSNIWFYILSIVNGLLVCLPSRGGKEYRLLLFWGRMLTFFYTFYFFVVFLPFLPFSVLAVIAFGAGFLLLAPLLLFVIHITVLYQDFHFLEKFYPKSNLLVIAIAGILCLPSALTGSYLQDKYNLEEVLEYLYTPDYSKTYDIDKEALRKVLDTVVGHKDKRRGSNLIETSKTPYLSIYYNWLVLDNLTLSDAKINHIENVFFGTSSFELDNAERLRNKDVYISDIKSNSVFDKEQNAWVSWVDLEIINDSDRGGDRWNLQEYATTLTLPDGCWISDYYLYVGDQKESGILAEKKTAMWIFSQIRNENKDPGLLYYLTGNRVAFRVFPFTDHEIRKTGIQLIHKEPFVFEVDDHKVMLGSNSQQQLSPMPKESPVIYVSSEEKKQLKVVERTPYYHFIVDKSITQESIQSEFKENIQAFLQKHKVSDLPSKISYVNSYVKTETLSEGWEDIMDSYPCEGGFYLERAVRKILFNHYQQKESTYPVIVVVTDYMQTAIVKKGFADMKTAFPESDRYYFLHDTAELIPYSLLSKPTESLLDGEVVLGNKVLAYPDATNPIAYLANDFKPEIILQDALFEIDDKQITNDNWQSGLWMQGKWLAQVFHPEITENNWLSLVRYSFKSSIMTPVTSFIVVENEAQRAMLKRKQEEVLSGNPSLDVGEDVQRMSEPELWVLALIVGSFMWYRHRKKKNRYC